jgi:hypothetical protein
MRSKTKTKKLGISVIVLVGFLLFGHGLISVLGFSSSALNLVQGEHYNASLIPDPCYRDLTESATIQVSVWYPYELTSPSVFVELYINGAKVSSGYGAPTNNIVQFSYTLPAANYPVGTYPMYAIINVTGKWSETLQPISELIVVDASAPPKPTTVYIQAFGDVGINGALVKVFAVNSGTQVFSGTTNEYNHVTVELEDGTYNAVVSKEGFVTQEKTFSVPSTTNVIFQMEKIYTSEPDMTLPDIPLLGREISLFILIEIACGIILAIAGLVAFKKL